MACISNKQILCSNTVPVFINWLMLAISSVSSMLSPCFSWFSEHWGPIFKPGHFCSLSQYLWKVPRVSFRVQRQSALDALAWLGAGWPRSLKCFGVVRHQESNPAADTLWFFGGQPCRNVAQWCKDKVGTALPAGRRELTCHLKGKHGTATCTVWFPTSRGHMYCWWYELHAVCWEPCLSAWGISFKRFDA